MPVKKRDLALAGIVMMIAVLLFSIIEIIVGILIVPEYHEPGDFAPPIIFIIISIIAIILLVKYLNKK